MEPIISKLQEGVKYPRFERDATTIINDLVEHITKERGVYSSSIEPNPSEHNVWFNTDNCTLYIYDDSYGWTTINENVEILKEGEFYPYPVINIYDENIDMYDWAIEENKHYVIIINTNNIREYLNNIVMASSDMDCIIIGDNTNTSGTFLVNIYDRYIYYIRLSSSYIKEDNVFYCSGGMLYYDADNTNHDGEGLNILGFYTKEHLRDIIENYEGISIETLMLNNIFIEPEDESTIIIGNQVFNCDVSILGADLNNANIYMYNNTLHIGNNGDNYTEISSINWYDVTVFCNCKQIGDITVTHIESSLDLNISSVNFIVGNNNTVTIDTTVCEAIDECNIYVINEANNDKSKVILGNTFTIGRIDEYVNLCGTKINRKSGNPIKCNTFVTTTLDDIDRPNDNTNPVDLSECNMLIIDAPYKYPTNNEYIRSLKSVKHIGVTDETLYHYLPSTGLKVVQATRKTNYFNDRVEICYMATNGGYPLYVKTIYKR